MDELNAIIQNIEFELFIGFSNFNMIDQMSKFLGILTALYPEYSEHFERIAQDFELKLEVFERQKILHTFKLHIYSMKHKLMNWKKI